MTEALKKNIGNVSTYSVKGLLNNHCYHLFLKSNKYAEECMRKSVDFINELRVVEKDVKIPTEVQ
jgi:hypothetical protein